VAKNRLRALFNAGLRPWIDGIPTPTKEEDDNEPIL
jgi:hypothetical protein